MTGTEIYKRTATYDRESREIRIHAPEWKLLLAYDGQKTLSEVALSAETSFADSIPLTEKFLGKDWIEECPITLDQYMKRINAKSISGTSTPVAPAVVVHEPKKEAPSPSSASSFASPISPVPAPTPSAPKTSPLAPLVKPAAVIPPSAPVPPPLPVTPAPTPSAVKPPEIVATGDKPSVARSSRSAMKLGAVVDFITSLVGNISLGQLLVYRVFLRVPPELLMAEDIASVHLANDTSLIKTEKLQKAIAEAVNAVTKRSLPDSVFAAA